MAKFEFDLGGLEDRFLSFSDSYEGIAIDGVKEAQKVLKKSVQSSLNTVSSNSHLAEKVKANPPKKAQTDAVIGMVTLKGTVESGMSAATAAFWLQYGTTKQPARDWITKAVNESEGQCQKIIEDRFGKAFDEFGLSL